MLFFLSIFAVFFGRRHRSNLIIVGRKESPKSLSHYHAFCFFFLRWRHRTKAPLITFLSDGTSSRATNVVSDTVTTFNKCFFARTMAIESEQMKTFFLFYFWLARWKSFSFVNIHEISIVSQTYRIVYAVFYCQPLNGAISPATKWLARTMNHMKFHLKRHQF